MAIVKFKQIYSSLKQELGKDMANELFPEYSTLPDRMPAEEQAHLAKVVTDRMDKRLDSDTIRKVRHKYSCKIPRGHLAKINELKGQYSSTDEIIDVYSSFFKPSNIERIDNTLRVSFGLNKCICGIFRKLEKYEPMSRTWCECCNGHTIKTFSYMLDKEVTSEIVETVATGGKDCIFDVKID